jgi:hypothetical protein
MAITGYAICNYATPTQKYTTKWSPMLCGYGNLLVHKYVTCSRAMRLWQFAGAKIPDLLSSNAATAIRRLRQYASYGNTPATAKRWRKKTQVSGSLAT